MYEAAPHKEWAVVVEHECWLYAHSDGEHICVYRSPLTDIENYPALNNQLDELSLVEELTVEDDEQMIGYRGKVEVYQIPKE